MQIFKEGWNDHGIRTVQHCSPRQLFVSGCLRLQMSGLTAMDVFDAVDESLYGIDNDEMTPPVATEEAVMIPESQFHIPLEVLNELHREIDPLALSDNHGIEIYDSVLLFLEERHVIT